MYFFSQVLNLRLKVSFFFFPPGGEEIGGEIPITEGEAVCGGQYCCWNTDTGAWKSPPQPRTSQDGLLAQRPFLGVTRGAFSPFPALGIILQERENPRSAESPTQPGSSFWALVKRCTHPSTPPRPPLSYLFGGHRATLKPLCSSCTIRAAGVLAEPTGQGSVPCGRAG